MKRPDLGDVRQEVLDYIEYLEGRLANGSKGNRAPSSLKPVAAQAEPATPWQVVSVTAQGVVKRTPRHLYQRQKRGGMGVFDLEFPDDDPPALLATAEESGTIVFMTSHGRAFRIDVAKIVDTDVRGRGESVVDERLGLTLRRGESIVAALPMLESSHIVLASSRGWVRRVRSSYLGPHMIQGTTFHDVKEGGYLSAACTADGTGHILLATVAGQGIRFEQRQIPARGCLGMRVSPDDAVTGVTATDEEGSVFVIGANGQGTIRLMTGFRANKSPGAGGKRFFAGDKVVDVIAVEADDDILVLSKQAKIIRFSAEEVPEKAGVVQGVNCMSLRSDEVVAVARLSKISEQSSN